MRPSESRVDETCLMFMIHACKRVNCKSNQSAGYSNSLG